MGAKDISWLGLLLTYAVIAVPILIFWYYQTGLVWKVVLSLTRMSVQLLLLGVYLKYVLEYDNVWLNLAWVFVMICVAAFTTVSRSSLKRKYFFMPVFLALLISVLLTDAFILGISINTGGQVTAQYLIPLTGMIIGNCMERNILVLGQYYANLRENSQRYFFAIANGATRAEALRPFMRDSLSKAFNPYIAMMMTMGIISLPGLMTGQILEGGSAMVAVKYQIMIILAIFASSALSVLLMVYFANKRVFDDYDIIRKEALS